MDDNCMMDGLEATASCTARPPDLNGADTVIPAVLKPSAVKNQGRELGAA